MKIEAEEALHVKVTGHGSIFDGIVRAKRADADYRDDADRGDDGFRAAAI